MQKRQLGKGGPMVGAIGVGCWSFAGAYGPTNEKESHETLAKALDLGMDFLDTANVYGAGVSEKVIGSFIKSHPGKFTIATKGAIRREPETNERVFDNGPEHLRMVLEKSLRDLGVDHVDLYYIHRREQKRPIEEVVETLQGFMKEGKIGGIGFSEISPSSLRRAHAVHPVMAVQSEYSLWSRTPDLGMVQTCADLGAAFVPFSPLGRGVFASKLPEPAKFGDGDFRRNNPRFLDPNYKYNIEAMGPFREFAAEMSVTPAQLALAWVLHQGSHLIPIPGTRSVAHLAENAVGADLLLNADNLEKIKKILPCGFAHGDRYSNAQWPGAERYC